MGNRKRLVIILLVAAAVLAAGGAFFLVDPIGWWRAGGGEAAEPGSFPGVEDPAFFPQEGPLSSRPFNVLILGLDHGLGRPQEGNERSDVIIIAHVDEAKQKACLLSIPRDSYVQIPGHGRKKINEAYALGGPQLAVKTVEQLTGMKMRNYLVLDFDEFRWVVDLFGGVEVTLERPISDPKLGYIPAGHQHLNGDRALIMARSRDYPQGDLERVRQQQRIIVQALYKGRQMAADPGAAWFLYVALSRLETDVTPGEAIRLAREFASFPVVDVEGGVAPGRGDMVGGASVYLLDDSKLRSLVYSIERQCTVPQEFR